MDGQSFLAGTLVPAEYSNKLNGINSIDECIPRLAQWRKPASPGTLAAGPALDYD